MSDTDLVVVFDLLDAGFKEWRFSAFGLIFVAIGLLFVRFPQTVMQITNWTRHPRLYKYFSRFWLGFAILWTLVAFASTYGDYLTLRNAYQDGRFEIVEGPVENFAPMPPSGRPRESFTVAGQEFSYSDFKVTAGYNTSRAHGSPIDAGVIVRIFHVHGRIVRVEVERSAVEAARARPPQSVGPLARKFPNFREGSPGALVLHYFWVFFLIAVLVNAAGWRWRGRGHIARDPALRQGYDHMAFGLAFWSGLPVFVMALASLIDGVNMFDLMGVFSTWSLWPILFHSVFAFVLAKWVYWTFYQDGAAKMARHPGFIDHEWVAKFWPLAFAGGYLFSFTRRLL